MKNGKKLFVYFFIFNVVSVFSAFSMDSSITHANATGSYVGIDNSSGFIVPSNNKVGFTQGRTIVDFLREKERERKNIILNDVRNKIDEKHLGINEGMWLREIRGAWNSINKAHSLTEQQVEDELKLIDSYVPVEGKKEMLKRLKERHWYVDSLLERSTNTKIEAMYKICGSTIDALCTISPKDSFKRMVHTRALEKYFDDMSLDYWPRPIGGLGAIHATVLYAHQHRIDRYSLAMSSDGKYVRALDEIGVEIVWDMEQGVETTLSTRDIVTDDVWWVYDSQKFGDSYEFYNDNYLTAFVTQAYVSHAANVGIHLEGYLNRALVLYKRPTKLAHFCNHAFYNSKNNHEELAALRRSRSCDDIEGFPKKNLKNFIKKEMDELEVKARK